MEELLELLSYVDLKIKNNVKENDYLNLVKIIHKIYLKNKEQDEKDDNNDEDDYNDIYGSY
jgi:hypothetical protein